MTYRYRDDIATADAAFDAWGESKEQLFNAAVDALMNVMVETIDSIAASEQKTVSLKSDRLDMLLFSLLGELIYYKDAEQLLLRIEDISIGKTERGWKLHAVLSGEKINPDKHDLLVDVKAVTLHRLYVCETESGWTATVVLDL
ncbi:Protein archease [subsurface metagenome]